MSNAFYDGKIKQQEQLLENANPTERGAIQSEIDTLRRKRDDDYRSIISGEMSEDAFVVTGTNTDLLIQLNICGHMSASNADRNFRLAYKVGSGSYTKFGFNPNGSISENIGSDFRGDDIQHGMNISFSFLIDGTWNAGDTITVRLETVGEGTFYHNGSISATDVRFGNGLSKLVLTEISD